MSELTKAIEDLKIAISWNGRYVGIIDLNLLVARLEKIDKQPQLDDNQQIVLDILKDIQNKWSHFHPTTTIGMMVEMQNEYYEELSKDQEAEVIQAFSAWVLEQEEAE